MFSHNNNHLFTGGTFTNHHVENHDHGPHYHDAKPRGMDLLLKASAPGAFHNSGERFDPPKCHPKTRVTVLTQIMNWVIGGVGFIMWLYGPAGAGKSAIAQTIAELCFAQKRLLASFFFSRSDPNRNHERSLIATLSYQIALNIPQAKPLIEQVVDDDPSIFQRSLETQCTSLVIEPILELFNSGLITGPFPYVVIIDGLDECRDSKVQRYILDIIASSLKEHYIPIMFLISSRPEPPISIAFNSLMLNDTTMRLALDDSFFPDADIECFLRDSFEEIRRNHPMNAFIPMTWPNNWDIQVLVAKSSGQFIYAATVIRYVSSFRHRPTDRLEVILGIRPPRNDTPFAELDYLYKNIFSSVEDTDAALRVLGVLLLPRNVPWDPEIPLSPLFHAINIRMPDALERFMFLNPGDIQQILIDLGSVVSFENQNTEIRVLHASLGDFLFDPLRSNEYYVEPASVHSTLAHLCLRHIEIHGISGQREMGDLTHFACGNVVTHCSNAIPTGQLRDDILKTTLIPSLLETYKPLDAGIVEHFFSFLKSSGHCQWRSIGLLYLSRDNFQSLPNPQELYIHHLKEWDQGWHRRLDKCPSDLLLASCIVLTDPEFPGAIQRLLNRILPPELVDSYAWPNFSYYSPLSTRTTVHARVDKIYYETGPKYHDMLLQFFMDPTRAGKHTLDGTKYATVAALFLRCISVSDSISHYGIYGPFEAAILIEDILKYLTILLSKSAYSDDLVSVVKDLHLKSTCRRFPGAVLLVKNAIVSYLVRVCGSVPKVQITIDSH